ncbi:hypothetical protein D9757_000641 [Collybiopsis confluens]|uniref:Uncharacterized protein n=1 Tax=Collybiopsis confluens TaxID=2823264 RepID=A0A8H5I139_9AGAR|nr:hypothetical protein D9757_000641 [Collybiopsis confluens]
MTDDGVHILQQLGHFLIDAIFRDEPIENIKEIVDGGAPLWYQNESEGASALHAAAYMQNAELVQFLIDQGAIWNSVDNLKNTAGEIALSFNNQEIYTIVRNAGIRAEMLLALLSSHAESNALPDTLVIRSEDSTAAASTDAFLASKLRFIKDENGQEICVVKAGDEEIGVMMGWEKEIMEETALQIDSWFQSLPNRPIVHYIVEPHADVLQYMKEQGWYKKTGVKVVENKWQDSIPELLTVGGFDVIYTDTFSEDYNALRAFFEHLPDLLAGPESRFSFFNGLGATNALFYDVYTHLAELHLADVGVNVEWKDVHVGEKKLERWGKTREYFSLPLYRLPIGSMGHQN